MQLLKGRWMLMVASGLMVVSFQNCAKIGHNAVEFQGESLDLPSEVVMPSEQLVVDSDNAQPGAGTGAPDKEPPAVSGGEIAEIVALCQDSERASGYNESQTMHLVQEKLDSIVGNVSSLSLVHSRVVLRAAGEAAAIDDAQLVHSDLVLCGFSKIRKIRSTQSRIFVVGGSVQDAVLVQSSLFLINAELKNHSGVSSTVKKISP